MHKHILEDSRLLDSRISYTDAKDDNILNIISVNTYQIPLKHKVKTKQKINTLKTDE